MITGSVAERPIGKSDHKANLKTAKSRTERYSGVTCCVDGSRVSSGVIPYAESLADAMNVDLRLLTVLEPDHEGELPFDPVEWSLRKREAKSFLTGLVDQYQLKSARTSATVLEGKSATVIGNCYGNSQQEILVFCRKDDHEVGHIGSTSRSVFERCAGSVFLVPAHKTTSEKVVFKRILVPLDSSTRAETVLPIASRLAQSCKATVVIVHAAPSPDVSEFAPGDTESENIRKALAKHNTSAAGRYVDRASRKLRGCGVEVESIVLPGGDTRRQLIDVIKRESIDLVILSSHGVSGHADVPFGDVASHIMSRSSAPALMLRDQVLTIPPSDRIATASDNSSTAGRAGRAPEGAE